MRNGVGGSSPVVLTPTTTHSGIGPEEESPQFQSEMAQATDLIHGLGR